MAEAVRHDKTARQLRLLSDALDSGRLGPVRRLVNTLSPAEIGNLLESLPPGKRTVVWGLVDPEDDGEVLVHVGDEVRERLEQVLSYAEDSAGRLMNPDVVTVRADTTVDVVLRYLRLRGELPEHTDHIYVVSKRHQYLGRIALQALLTHEAGTPINQLLDDEQPAIGVEETSEEVARQFSDHDWISAPVVDDNNILLGRITIDDVVDIIRDQAEHQALSAAGLDEDEDLFSPVHRAFRNRLIWLGVNLCTAFLAASVVDRFSGSIEQLAALAVLMPIVAGMGGNAGTQVLALMIRGLALGQIGASNVPTLVWKEVRVALINGLALGAVLGLVVLAWFRNPALAAVIASALTINLCFAALGGVFVPVTLKRLGFDPALAGGVILTTITDVMGFLTFLGLATLVLLG